MHYNGAPVVTNNVGSFAVQTTYNLYLGHRPAGGNTATLNFNGLMDEVSIYKSAPYPRRTLAAC